MARLHYDLHYIPVDNIDRALSLLIDAGLITRSLRDVCHSDLHSTKRCFPESGAFFEVKSFY